MRVLKLEQASHITVLGCRFCLDNNSGHAGPWRTDRKYTACNDGTANLGVPQIKL